MPKPRRTKQPEFLQFRPYHAFTTQDARPARSMAKWWLLLTAAAVLVLLLLAFWLSHRG